MATHVGPPKFPASGFLARLPAGPSRLWRGWTAKLSERRPLVHGDVIRLVALDQVLGGFLRGAHGVSLELHRRADLLADHSAHAAGLGIPAHVVPDLESALHDFSPA